MNEKSLDKKWLPQEKEPQIYDKWIEKKFFEANANSDKPSFSIVLPPPNVTGSLHLGHALGQTLMDITVRRKRMQGFETLWLPGTDHAGIATQSLVEKKLLNEGIKKEDLGREKFLAEVWEAKNNSANTMVSQIKSLGNSVDWSRERFTMDEVLTRAVRTIFKRLFDDGLIYRAERLVNWSPTLKTALSDIEVSYSEVEGELVYFKYGDVKDENNSITVATTRIETILGDVAIAVNPQDKRYQNLVGKKFKHPFLDREVEVIADDHVDMDFGTGAVKITPAHDPNDFEMAARHNLPIINIFDDAASIVDTGTEFDGLERFSARKVLREKLAAADRLVKVVSPYMHSVGHSERSGEPIEPKISMQWWLKVDSLAKKSSDLVKDHLMELMPESAGNRWFDWVNNMHDWCISRQLWWGHRIPVWYGPDGQMVSVGPDEEPPVGWVQDEDVLDTWFSSGLWPFASLGWPEHTPDLNKFYPTSLLVTGYDILFFWVARMTMFASYISPEFSATSLVPPFKKVFLHGLVRDGSGKKMSKSKGNVIDPMNWINEYGADATRFTLARGAYGGSDVSVSEDSIISSRNFITKLYNVGKFLEINNVSNVNTINEELNTEFDIWILDRLHSVIAEVDIALSGFDFGKYCDIIYHFFWDEFCDWYVEFSKVQLKFSEAEVDTNNTKAVLFEVFQTILKLMHPVIPFVTEYLWRFFTGEETITKSDWPQFDLAPLQVEAIDETNNIMKIISELRKFRNEQGVKPNKSMRVSMVKSVITFTELEKVTIQSLGKVEITEEKINNPMLLEVSLDSGVVYFNIDISDAVDFSAEIARLQKNLQEFEKDYAATTKKLANENFINKAPKNVVEEITSRNNTAKAEIERIKERIKSLESHV